MIARESLIMERLPLDGARVIDIGCGEGWLTQLVAPETSTVIGIDPSATALERANAAKNNANETFLLASAENLPLNDASTDIAIYYNSLHHVPAALQSKAFEETARVLVDDGLLCIIEPMARGSAYELFQPVDDESKVYDTTYKLIRGVANGVEFRQVEEERFVDWYTYRDFEQFFNHVLVVDVGREAVLVELEDMMRERFDRLGEAVEGGRRYDQVHRFSLLRKL
jgi:ubiquinone/menaquinone biosynthesis C-methylase UbiE